MSDFSDIIASAAAEAETVLSESLTGPDGVSYTGVFRAASAFELASAGQEMQSHGFSAKTLMILAMTRAQFSGAVPYNWRQKKVSRTSPNQQFTVLSLNVDDPNFFVFPISFQQPAA